MEGILKELLELYKISYELGHKEEMEKIENLVSSGFSLDSVINFKENIQRLYK